MSDYLICTIYHKIHITAAQKFERYLLNNFMGPVAMALRFFLMITPLLFCVMGVSFAAASDKSLYNVFKKIGYGDFEKGVDHVWRHANGGNGTATLLLSRLFLEFDDLENSEKYLHISADQNNPIAMKIMGVTFLNGSLNGPDYVKARFWFEKSAKYRNINSMMYLGIMHRDGLGTNVDLNKSYFWFSLAGILKSSKTDDKEPEDFAKELENELSERQIMEVGKQTYAWLTTNPVIAPQVIPPL